MNADLDAIEAAMRRGEWRALPDLIAEVRALREVLRRITARSERPAGRGPYIEHKIDEGHRPDQPCDICAALGAS